MSTAETIRLEAALAGLLVLEVARREDRDEKTEVLLSAAGLTNEEIALATGKGPDAVRMVIARARPAKKKKSPNKTNA